MIRLLCKGMVTLKEVELKCCKQGQMKFHKAENSPFLHFKRNAALGLKRTHKFAEKG